MEQELRNLLSDEISREFKLIPTIESGSKEQQMAVNNAIALYRLMIDDLKVESETKRLNAEHRLALKKQKEEVELKIKQFELEEKKSKVDEEKIKEELRIKKKQYEIEEAKYYNDKENRKDDKKDERKDRIFKWSIGIAELMLPMIFYAVWMKRGFEFERTGTYTSTTFRGLFSNFKPVKR